MGGLLKGSRFDDVNRATCSKCKHRGTLGDWERLAQANAEIARLHEAILSPLLQVTEEALRDAGVTPPKPRCR
jgi:NMD protein affecting ribosome stability and mRNA decay